jgi:hypothetical protein
LRLSADLQGEHPAAAWVLYRALLLDILDRKQTKAYQHAADYLAMTTELAERANLAEKQQELLLYLRDKHGRKYSFWNLVNE